MLNETIIEIEDRFKSFSKRLEDIEFEQSEDRKLVEKRHNTVERFLKELLSKHEEATLVTNKTEETFTNPKRKR